MWKPFNAQFHEADEFKIEKTGVKISQETINGSKIEVYLTKEALEELYKASKNN